MFEKKIKKKIALDLSTELEEKQDSSTVWKLVRKSFFPVFSLHASLILLN